MSYLYVKSYYSLLSSLLPIKRLVSFCKEKNMPSIALTDDNLYGAMEFLKACEQNGIHGVLGLELYLEKGSLLLYAKNYHGYQNLAWLSTVQSERMVTTDEFLTHIEDLFVIIPFASRDLYPSFSALQPYLGYTNSKEEMEALMLTKQVVFLPKILAFTKKEEEYLPYLMMIRDGKTIADEFVMEEGIHSFSDSIGNFSNNDGILNGTRILDACHIEFPEPKLLLPIYPTEEGLTSHQYLQKLSVKGLTKRLHGNVSDVYKTRLTYELSVIEKMGFSNYFLVVYDFIKYAKKNGILVGPGRGSAAGSLVAYSLGITEIDPVHYDLLFERFLNPERVTMPDIDTDFPDVYRDQVIDYVISKYGKKRVAGIVTFGTLGAKQVIRDVSRVLNIPLYKVDMLCKYIPVMSKDSLQELKKKNDRFRLALEEDESLAKMVEIASVFEGFPRHTSSHAAGIVMSQVDLDEVIPLTYNDGMYLTGYSMEYLEDLGLLKMDFLGLKNLTTIMNVLHDIELGEGIKIDFNQIPLDDERTLSIFTTANTSGIFQFESTGMRNFLRQLKPNTFEDIFAAIALFRPGPSINIPSYIRRKHKEEVVTYLDPSLESVLKSTYGIIVYQEQIMQIAQIFAGYSLGEADILRRAMSKKKIALLQSEEERFIRQSVERGHTKEKAKEVYDLILNFANYGFNRSHSVAYSLIAYKMAYLKAYYPKYFFASLFTGVIGSEMKTKEYMEEARINHLSLLKPDINSSSDRYTVEKEGIRYPLSNIRNVGIVACKDILETRKDGLFQDIFDFFGRVHKRSITRKVIESLIDASCFDRFGYNHATLFHNLDALLNYQELAKDLDPDFILKPEIEVVAEYPKEMLMMKEKEVFSFYFSDHPASSIRPTHPKAILVKEVPNYFNRQVEMIVLVENLKTITTKKGDRMAFLSGSDETGTMDFTLFPKVFERYNDVQKGQLYVIRGNVEKRLDQYQVIVQIIKKVDK